MAQKRMFDKRITDSDKFVDLPNSTKALYFMAGMSADDRGFFQPRRLQKLCGFTDDDYKVLIAKGYLIPFESGVMVITDWNKNNWLDKRRLTETEYTTELNLLRIINEKYELIDTCLADAKPMLRENRIEENRIEQNSIIKYAIKNNFDENVQCDEKTKTGTRCLRKSSFNINGRNYCNQHARELIPYIEIKEEKFKRPTLEEVETYCKERNNGIDAEAFINYYTKIGWVYGKNRLPIKDWKACVRTWEKNNKNKPTPSWFDKDLDKEGTTIDDDITFDELLKGLSE